MSGEELEVKVLVPRERVADFYAMVGQWLAGPEEEDTTEAEPGPWSEDDLELAQTIWGKMSEPAHALFGALMERPDESISGEQLAKDLDIANGRLGVAGVLAWPTRYCHAVQRILPIWWESGDYLMHAEDAALFAKARAGVA